MNKLEQAVKNVSASVPMLRSIATSKQRAFEDEMAAEMSLLEALIEELTPVLDALATLTVTDAGSVRGVKISGSWFLLPSGQFVDAAGRPVSRASVLKLVGIEQFAVFFADLLERQVNGRASLRTREAQARAATLNAVVVLLRKGTV